MELLEVTFNEEEAQVGALNFCECSLQLYWDCSWLSWCGWVVCWRMLADTSGWGWWGCSAAAGQCAQPSVLQPRPAPPPPSLHCSVSPRPPARQHTAKNIFVPQKYFMWWSKSVFSLQKSFHGCILLSYGKELLQSSALGLCIKEQRAKYEMSQHSKLMLSTFLHHDWVC